MLKEEGWYFLAQDEAEPVGPFATERAAELASQGKIMAFDRATVRSLDADGRLHVASTPISKSNVCPYYGREIPNGEELGLEAERLYMLFRDPDELEKAATSFNNLPLLSKHVPVSALDHHPELVVGSTGTDAMMAGPYLKNSLVVWSKDAIEGIVTDEKKELSSAYRYRADMTPGVSAGVHYDGVMRDIIGNHVALVEEGRAGSDVIVGDSKENCIMSNKTVLSRRATQLRGGLTIYLKPKMAQDSKLDLDVLLAGISSKNFADKKAGLITALKSGVKLAKDAKLDDLERVLEVLGGEGVEEGLDADPNTGLPMGREELSAAMDDEEDPKKKAREFMMKSGKFSEDELKGFDEYMGGDPSMDEEVVPAVENAEGVEGKEAVTPAAMDTAIKKAAKIAEDKADAKHKALREAERKVRPYVGELAMSFDSADGVYEAALKTLGVKVDGIHPSAFPALLGMQTTLADRNKKRDRAAEMALDSVDHTSFDKAFPDAARIGSL